MSTTQEKIAVMQAFLDGKAIEYRSKFESSWQKLTPDSHPHSLEPNWRWDVYDYRIKPEPREYTIWRHGDSSVIAENHSWGENIRRDWREAGWVPVKVREILD